MEEFYKISRLPPYTFNIVRDLLIEARRKGEDIIDLGMGNPDLETPKAIVAKLVEAAKNPRNHRYSVSRGIYKLRVAISDWYKRRYHVDIDPETEAVVTMGAKEGISHLVLATINAGDVVFVPEPTYPIHTVFRGHSRRGPEDSAASAIGPVYRTLELGDQDNMASAKDADRELSQQSHDRSCGTRFL